MRIVFMGTPEFAVPALTALVEGGHKVVGVVTQPDRPKGRGKAVLRTPVKEKALEYGLKVYQPPRVREPQFTEILKALKPDIMVVAAFGQILPGAILEIAPLGCVNIHASLLPRYRGASPIQQAIIDGEKETGITTMMMDEGLDTGDILEKIVMPIAEGETGGSLHDKLKEAGAGLILTTLRKLEEGTMVRTPQTEEGASYAKQLNKQMGDIDWAMEGESIERLVRGLDPWPGTYTGWNGKTIKIWKARVLQEENDGVCGEVVVSDRHRLFVKTGKGTLSILELQPEGKKRMAVEEFLRGYPVKEHTVFSRAAEGTR